MCVVSLSRTSGDSKLEGWPLTGLGSFWKREGSPARAAVVDAFGTHLTQAGPDDVALFYFSGHGSQQRTAASTAASEPDLRNETIVLVEGQPMKDDGVHNREDRGRRADAEREHDEGGERRAFG